MEQLEINVTLSLDCNLSSSLLKDHLRTKLDSQIIINHSQYLQLFRFSELNCKRYPRLLYRASRDGFGCSDFHEHCDGYLKCVIIIKSDEDDVFGFYATRDLASNSEEFERGILMRDDESFTFRLEKDQCYIFRLDKEKAGCPLVTYDENLLLSYAYSFWIADESNVHTSASQEDVEDNILPECRLPHDKRYFSREDFLVKEIEVFHLVE